MCKFHCLLVFIFFSRLVFSGRELNPKDISSLFDNSAVTGLPEPRKGHAVAMARFARDCMQRMKVLVVKLEVPLGPGTADLSMRFGLHSGPVTVSY